VGLVAAVDRDGRHAADEERLVVDRDEVVRIVNAVSPLVSGDREDRIRPAEPRLELLVVLAAPSAGGNPVLPYFAFFFELLLESVFTSTFLAVIVYSMVTLSPGLRSVLSSPRAISQLSLPFFTTMELASADTTGPVTWYLWSPEKATAGMHSAAVTARVRKVIPVSFGVVPAPRDAPAVPPPCQGRDARAVGPCRNAAAGCVASATGTPGRPEHRRALKRHPGLDSRLRVGSRWTWTVTTGHVAG